MIDLRESEFYQERITDEEAIGIVDQVTSKLKDAEDTGFLSDIKCLIEFIKCGDWSVRMLALAGLIYFLQPLDILPDYIPFIGWADDIIVVAVVVKQCMNLLSSLAAKDEGEG